MPRREGLPPKCTCPSSPVVGTTLTGASPSRRGSRQGTVLEKRDSVVPDYQRLGLVTQALYWRSPESGNLWGKSGISKVRIRPHSKSWLAMVLSDVPKYLSRVDGLFSS